MTASARCKDQGAWGEATWEIRSVNHRFLDCHIHLPDFLSLLETDIREIIRTKLQRGRIDCYLRYKPSAKTELRFAVDENLLGELAKSIALVQSKLGESAPVDPISILSWPHIIKQEESNAGLADAAILSLLKQALKDLVTARAREGAALKVVIERILATIEKEIAKIKHQLPQVLHSAKQKINARFAELKINLDPVRLEQEIVLFAQKADVTEELDRLEIHIKEFNRVLASGRGVGKRLDFLTQELNRETNTLASKSVDAKITQAAVEVKVLIEQIREQVQNLE